MTLSWQDSYISKMTCKPRELGQNDSFWLVTMGARRIFFSGGRVQGCIFFLQKVDDLFYSSPSKHRSSLMQ